MFAGKKAEQIESFERHLNQHNVIRLDVQRFVETERDLDTFIRTIEGRVVVELTREFPECGDFDSDSRPKDALEQIFDVTGRGFIFIIDEWDCVFRMAKERKDIQKEYPEFVRAVKVGGWDGLMDALNRWEKLLYDTWELDGEAVAAGVELWHITVQRLIGVWLKNM